MAIPRETWALAGGLGQQLLLEHAKCLWIDHELEDWKQLAMDMRMGPAEIIMDFWVCWRWDVMRDSTEGKCESSLPSLSIQSIQMLSIPGLLLPEHGLLQE